MAHFEVRFWESIQDGVGLPRRARASGSYDVYVPDALIGRTFSIAGTEAADIADAERTIYDLDRSVTTLADTEALARLLLRAESVASSHIEGLEIGPRRLLRADAARDMGEVPQDVTAAEVLANIDAMEYAIHAVNAGDRITPALLLEAHRRLLEPTSLARHGGKLRTTQNWIGGSDYNPLSAAFVPPPPEMVPALLDDLCAFSNEDSLPAVAQAAIAHAQFETIHPFADGNGRVGRALIHLIFRQRKLTNVVSPPVSLILATRSRDYISGLSATRYDGAPDSPQAIDGMNLWLGTFAAACTRAAADARQFETRIKDIKAEWLERLPNVRTHSAVLRIIEVLPRSPIVTIAELRALTDRSTQRIQEAVERLQEIGILTPDKVGRQRKQVFQARDIIEAFTDLERQLASPAGDSHVEPPTRAVPARRQV